MSHQRLIIIIILVLILFSLPVQKHHAETELTIRISYSNLSFVVVLLTLGAHAQEGYFVCLSVCPLSL